MLEKSRKQAKWTKSPASRIWSLLLLMSTRQVEKVESFRLLASRNQVVKVTSPLASRAKSVAAALAATSDTATRWEVYVDQSKAALDKGASATLDAFLGLAPPDQVTVIPAILTATKTTKSKAPAIRCIALTSDQKRIANNIQSFDVGNMDSVDKVFRILQKHMQVKGVSIDTCECLKWKYKGNGYLEAGKVSLAIDAYDKALTYRVREQEGIILFMRANAYLQRANQHREKLKEIVAQLTAMVPDTETLQAVFTEAANAPANASGSIANSLFRRVLSDTAHQETKFRQTQYRHGLYQYALLQAAQDSLRATQLLPVHADSWRRAGDILSELWKLKESAQYYVRAMELDPSLSDTLLPLTKRLNKQQELLDSARAYGWSEETLRLALDVAR